MSGIEDITNTDVAVVLAGEMADQLDANGDLYVEAQDSRCVYVAVSDVRADYAAPSGASTLNFTLTDSSGEARTFRVNITATEVRNVGS